MTRRRGGWGGRRRGAGRKPIVQDPVRLGIDHEREDVEALKALAKRRGLSVAEIVRRAVRAYLQRHWEK